MADEAKCGAKTQSGGSCKNKAGFRTTHPNYGRCFKHGGASENGTKAAARAQVLAMASEADADPNEVLLKTIRIDWGAVTWLQERIAGLEYQEAVDDDGKRSVEGDFLLWQQLYGEWVDRRGSAKSGMWGSTCGDGSQRPGSRPRACSVAPCLQGHGSPPGQVSAAWRSAASDTPTFGAELPCLYRSIRAAQALG